MYVASFLGLSKKKAPAPPPRALPIAVPKNEILDVVNETVQFNHSDTDVAPPAYTSGKKLICIVFVSLIYARPLKLNTFDKF